MSRWGALVLTFLVGLPVAAQQPRAPQVPPLGIPRGGKQTKPSAEPTITISGILRRLSDKELVLEAQDSRILTFTRTQKTTFYKNSAEAKPSEFTPGDWLFVEATQDEEGFLHAVAVAWQKAGTPEERARAAQPVEPSVQRSDFDEPPPVLRRAGSRAQEKTEEAAARREPEPRVVREAEPPARIGPDDPGPPPLRRGAPARSGQPADAEAKLPEPLPEPPAAPPREDPLIEKARRAVAAYNEKLPNYICRQMTTRYQSRSRPVNWKAVDVISADVVYENGREQYRNIEVNGKRTDKTLEQLGGAWSKGEYGSVLADLFSPATAAEFLLRKNETIAGVDAAVYVFFVEQPNSHWSVHVPSQVIRPAYGGSVWIDRKNGRVMRIEMQAQRLPLDFPLDTVEVSVDYQYVRLGDATEHLLPVHAEMLTCQRATGFCSRNAADFRNYRRFEGEATIKYEQ
ncbi:MAG TPA: hypothetical protein PLA43_07470 [Bryobacteraceae bacterium]|nr:hypothetical protein [Bryobacteraceae bacterium]HPU71780.1 hypothetical protein [Bryobacteraceae bacterium]